MNPRKCFRCKSVRSVLRIWTLSHSFDEVACARHSRDLEILADEKHPHEQKIHHFGEGAVRKDLQRDYASLLEFYQRLAERQQSTQGLLRLMQACTVQLPSPHLHKAPFTVHHNGMVLTGDFTLGIEPIVHHSSFDVPIEWAAPIPATPLEVQFRATLEITPTATHLLKTHLFLLAPSDARINSISEIDPHEDILKALTAHAVNLAGTHRKGYLTHLIAYNELRVLQAAAKNLQGVLSTAQKMTTHFREGAS